MNRTVDARSDLYALGVTLYEALTGSLPFREQDPMELVHSHIARAAPRPNEIVPAIPAAVCDIVMKLLAKAAEDRYQSAGGLKLELAYLEGDYVGAVAMAREAEARSASPQGAYFLTELAFFAFLAHAAVLSAADAEADAAPRCAAELDRREQQMAIWANSAPSTYRHRYLLMRAERARMDGADGEARELYDQAVEGARASEFLRHEAIANEVAARCYLGRGDYPQFEDTPSPAPESPRRPAGCRRAA